MKLYTDEGNFNSLKIIVAGQLGRDKLEVVKVKPDGKFKIIKLIS